jgi:hypothetical protein
MDKRSPGDTHTPTLGRMGRRLSIRLALAGCFASVVRTSEAAAEQPVQQATDVDGVTAEILQCRRKAAALTVVLRFKNEGFERTEFSPLGQQLNYDQYYLTVGMRKYFILRDSDDKAIAKFIVRIELNPGESWTFWAKFPAPPPDVKAVEIYTPLTLPFEDVAIVD